MRKVLSKVSSKVSQCTIAGLVFVLGVIVLWEHINPKHTQYEVLIENSIEAMQFTIERRMRNGWELHGPTEIQIIMGNNGQMMIVVQTVLK